jgi:hypothetical protein
MINILKNSFSILVVCTALFMISGCAHQIAITPEVTPKRVTDNLSAKKVAYLMTDEQRNVKVTTAGGGGDKVSYYPYRDLEKSIRDALSAVYSDVQVINVDTDIDKMKSENLSYLFKPTIKTSSDSDSIFTWPPTSFTIDLKCIVLNENSKPVTDLTVTGTGNAEFSEFKMNFGLAGSRAANDLSEKLKVEILKNKNLL